MSVAFDRVMFDLVREIHRRVPADVKPDVNLSNPYLLGCLQVQFRETSDVALQVLIQGLFERADDGWFEQLVSPRLEATQVLMARVYRGQSVVDAA